MSSVNSIWPHHVAIFRDDVIPTSEKNRYLLRGIMHHKLPLDLIALAPTGLG